MERINGAMGEAAVMRTGMYVFDHPQDDYSDDDDDEYNFEFDADDDSDEDSDDDDDDDDFNDHHAYPKNNNNDNDDIDAAHTPTVDNAELLQYMPTCPITLEPIQRPVVAADGHTYERDAILEWFRNNPRGCCSPMTNQPFYNLKLVPNYAVVKMVEELKATQQQHQQPQLEQQQQQQQQPQLEQQQKLPQLQHHISLNLLTKMAQWKWWFPQQVEIRTDSIGFPLLIYTTISICYVLRPFHSKTFEEKAPGAVVAFLQQQKENGMMVIVDILTMSFFCSFLHYVFQIQWFSTTEEIAKMSYSLPQIVLGLIPFIIQGFVYYYDL